MEAEQTISPIEQKLLEYVDTIEARIVIIEKVADLAK